MKSICKVLSGLFAISAFAGLVGTCSVDSGAENWLQLLIIFFSMFIGGIGLSLFFSNPHKYLKYLFGLFILIIVAIYSRVHSINEFMRCTYMKKCKCGSYRNMFKESVQCYEEIFCKSKRKNRRKSKRRKNYRKDELNEQSERSTASSRRR